MEACVRLPVIQTESRLGGRLWHRHRPRGPQLTSYLKSLGGRLWPECRPELRNHGVGWVRAVERLRNGGVPPNAVFLMPATHCVYSQQEATAHRPKAHVLKVRYWKPI